MKKAPLFFLAVDDEDDRMLFTEALNEIDPDIKCIMARNGKEALILLQNELFEVPDYIFLDLNMPIMNGLKCLAEIKDIDFLKNIPVVIYSTSSEKEFIEQSKNLGAINFFIKPSDFNSLSRYLKEMIEGRSRP
ncbi:MAG: response regulator [Ferruginibacter sp.]